MSRKCLSLRNLKRKKLSKKFDALRRKLKTSIYDKNISLEERYNIVMSLSMLPRNSARVRIKNRCNITDRPKAYYRKFGISRIMLRELAGKGEIPGLLKSSW
jgi:small subunit ribosomal protein S14